MVDRIENPLAPLFLPNVYKETVLRSPIFRGVVGVTCAAALVQLSYTSQCLLLATLTIGWRHLKSKKVEPLSKPLDLNPAIMWFELKKKTKDLKIDYIAPSDIFATLSKTEQLPKHTIVQVNELCLPANQIELEDSNLKFIAAQTPFTNTRDKPNTGTASLFWDLFYQQDATVVNLMQHSQQLDYSADNIDLFYATPVETKVFGKYKITHQTEVELLPSKIVSSYYKVLNRESFLKKTIEVVGCSNWPDGEATDLPTLATLVDKVTLALLLGKRVVIHCLAGKGRTGTLITACYVKQKIEWGLITKDNLKESLMELILKLRQQRGPDFINKKDQLKLLIDYAEGLLAGKRSPVDFAEKNITLIF